MSDGLLSDLARRSPANLRSSCAVTRIMESLESKEREAIKQAIEKIKNEIGIGRAKVYSSAWLAQVLNKNGFDISASTIARHIAGRCRCE